MIPSRARRQSPVPATGTNPTGSGTSTSRRGRIRVTSGCTMPASGGYTCPPLRPPTFGCSGKTHRLGFGRKNPPSPISTTKRKRLGSTSRTPEASCDGMEPIGPLPSKKNLSGQLTGNNSPTRPKRINDWTWNCF